MPILEALGRLGRELEAGQLTAVLQQHAPTWLAQLPALVDLAVREELRRQVAGATPERMLRELCDALEVLTVERPLLLVLEDLHWSDTATLAWVAAVARRPDPARLFVIGTYRPAEVVMQTHPLRGLVQELRAHQLCREVRLEVLSADEVREYLHQRFASSAAADELGLRLYERTDGNPLFLTASVDALIQQGLVVEEGGRWVVRGDLAAIEGIIPEDLQQLITKQVEALNVEEQQMLAAASVDGVTFTAAEVAAGCKQEPEAVEEACARLAQRGQVIEGGTLEEWPDGTLTTSYSFRHALYHQVVYARLGDRQTVRLHRLLGGRKEVGYRDQETAVAGELAVHFACGREPGKAAQYYHLAAEQALRLHAPREAIVHCTKGVELLSLLPDTPERRKQELALRSTLSPALVAIHGAASPELEQNLKRAYALCQEAGDRVALVPVLTILTRLYMSRADRAKTEELLEQERQLLPQLLTPADAILLHTQLGSAEATRGAHARGQEHHARVLELYDPTAHRSLLLAFGFDPLVIALSVSGWSLCLSGWPERAWSWEKRALAYAEDLAHPLLSGCDTSARSECQAIPGGARRGVGAGAKTHCARV